MMGKRAQFWKQGENDQGAIVLVGSSSTERWKDLPATFPAMKIAHQGQ